MALSIALLAVKYSLYGVSAISFIIGMNSLVQYRLLKKLDARPDLQAKKLIKGVICSVVIPSAIIALATGI